MIKTVRRLLLLLAIVVFVANCDQVDFTAPPGSTLTITVQPPSVATFGIANITVIGTRGTGAPLADGTVIHFTTNLGTVHPNPAETDNGIATAQFRSGSRSGTATITATSGAQEGEGATFEVIIGEARPAQLVLVADPSNLPVGGGTIELRAHVSDEDGNPLAGISVFFEADAGELASSGRTVRTNDAGIAIDRLTTNVETNVTATTANGVASDDFVVRISPGGGAECGFTFSPEEPVVGQEVFFVSTATANEGPPIEQFLWDFGDGTSAEGRTVSHSYDTVGTFVVVHTVIDEDGFTTVCEPVTITVTRGEPECIFSFSPTDPENGDTVNFDASESDDPNGEIVSYTWNFGDGTPPTTQSDPFIQHIFPLCDADDVTRDFTVILTVTDDGGEESSCSELISVQCPD